MSYIGDHYFVNPNGYCFVLRDRTLTGDEIIEDDEGEKYHIEWYETDVDVPCFHSWFAIPVE